MDVILEYVWAFLIGGAFCVVAQILLDKTALSPARILVGYVTAGVFLGAVGLYEPLMRFAGAGASTPLTGFGYVIAKGVKTAIDSGEKGVLGVIGGGLEASSAVISAVLVMSFIAAIACKKRTK